jgi:S-adenosylmethionine-diacylglycerol 3-amino-3-carboxypropyl transferase
MSGSRFFQTINYASVNEDWRTEAAALRIGPSDTVLCVTGSGDRPLDLLPHLPERIVAIDLNPAQNRLLVLKMAAMLQLPFEEYAAFLGLHTASGEWRMEVWRRLRGELPVDSQVFWQSREHMIRAGVLYQGRWERHYRRVSRLARLLRGRAIRTLFEFDDIEDQRIFVHAQWDTTWWRKIYRPLCSPFVSRLFFGDPAFYAHVAVPVGPVLYERMLASLERYLARENFMISLVLRGRLPQSDLPPYLTPDGYAAIRGLLGRIDIVTADVVTYLHAQAPGTFSRFSLSDVPSFLTADGFNRMTLGVIGCAAPKARVCIRQFLTRYSLPPHLESRFAREPELETRLAAEDRAFAYEFFIAEVRNA